MQAPAPRDPTETGHAGNRPRGLFITGNDTGVGKTHVACLLAKMLVESGKRVGVYKPVASGCRRESNQLLSDDAVALWEAAGQPKSLVAVCPQLFEAALAPNQAAKRENRQVDSQLLRSGANVWQADSDFLIVEGAGGYLSPLSDVDLNADLALDLGFPILLVVANRLGAINQAITTVHAIQTYRGGARLAGVVLNDVNMNSDDAADANQIEIQIRLPYSQLVRLRFGETLIKCPISDQIF
jgi:dethiobiotin synthetase